MISSEGIWPSLLQATLRHALGFDHRKLTYPRDGRLDSLTDADVTKAKGIEKLLS